VEIVCGCQGTSKKEPFEGETWGDKPVNLWREVCASVFDIRKRRDEDADQASRNGT
jgi:hypothetical protein